MTYKQNQLQNLRTSESDSDVSDSDEIKIRKSNSAKRRYGFNDR